VIVELAPDAAVDRALAAISRVASLREITVEGRTLRARAERGAAALPLAIAALEEAALPVASATVARPSLDDVYLRHTGRSFAAGDAHASDTHINEKEKAA
jgi:ABC-2 type transport system ATP-binding protein